jgi:hypothetical protein
MIEADTSFVSTSIPVIDRDVKDDNNRNTNTLMECVIELLVIYQAYGLEINNEQAEKLVKRAHHYLTPFVTKHGWMTVMKYKCAAFYAAWHGNELPKRPGTLEEWKDDDPKVIFGGRAGRWVQLLHRSQSETNHWESFTYAVNQAKKGMPRPNEEERHRSLQKTIKVLTTPQTRQQNTDAYKWGTVSAANHEISDEVTTVLTDENLIKEIKRTVREIFPRINFKSLLGRTPYTPSFNSTYVSTRGQLGQFSAIEETMPVNTVFGTDPLYLVRDDEQEEISNTPMSRYKLKGMQEFELDFQKYRTALLEAIDETKVNVDLLALSEPLKVRTISKGPGDIYFLLKPIQKYMTKVLRKLPQSQLVGNVVTEEILLSVLGRGVNVRKKGKYFLSVDYEAATDNLRSICSTAVWEEFMSIAEMDHTKLFRLGLKALTGHIIDVYEHKTTPGEYYSKDELLILTGIPSAHFNRNELPEGWTRIELDQMNGQLMGSILSFNVLEIVNLTVCRLSKEIEAGRRIALKDCPILCNGDDAVMPVNQVGDEAWQRISAFAGLIPSVGKVLRHKHLLNINSTVFRSKDYNYEEIKYLNLGLAKGLSRSTNKMDKPSKLDLFSTVDSLGTRHRDLKDKTPDYLWNSANRIFMLENKTVLEEVKVPWFIPEHLGGIGLVGEASEMDLIIARAIINGFLKESPKPVMLPRVKNIMLHDYVSAMHLQPLAKIISKENLGLNQPNAAAMNALYAAAVYYHPLQSVAPRKDYTIKGVLVKKTDYASPAKEISARAMTALSTNRRVWTIHQRKFAQFGKLKPFRETYWGPYISPEGDIDEGIRVKYHSETRSKLIKFKQQLATQISVSA